MSHNFKNQIKMATKKINFVFTVLSVAAWTIFVGLCIEAGALIVNFIFSLYNPGMVDNLYQKMDLSQMYERSKVAYFSMYSFILVIAVLKAYLFYILIRLTTKLNLEKPFSPFVSKQITQISRFTFAIGLISYIARETSKNLQRHGYELEQLEKFWVDYNAFILMAAVVYVIALIFKKGIEIQSENELTI